MRWWKKSKQYSMEDANVGHSEHGAFVNFFLHFRALFVKMFLSSLRKRGQTIAEILLAYAFIGLLLGMRYILERQHLADYRIPRFSPQYAMVLNVSLSNVTYYHPSNPCTDFIVTKAANELHGINKQFPIATSPLSRERFASFSNDDLLFVHAYIIFTNMDSCVNQSTMPNTVEYTLRMQENGMAYYRANEVKLVDSVIRTKRAPEDFCQDTSVLINYVNQFLGLQYAIDMSIIQYTTNVVQNLKIPTILLNHFGCPTIEIDQLHTIYTFFVNIFISIVYSITFIITVGYIVEERENKTKEYLRIYGLRTWVNNLVWFSRSMCIYIVLTGVLTGFCYLVLPSTNLQKDSISKSLFETTHWTLVWTILFVYSIHVSAFTVFFSQFFQRPLMAKIFGFIIWFFTFIDFYTNASVGVLYFLCIFPNVGLLLCVEVLLQYERKFSVAATFSQLYSNLFPYELYIGICLLLMLIHSCIFMILAIYIERINPGAFGISQPWNYLCKMGYWKSRRSYITQKNNVSNNNNKDDFITIENNHWVESNSFSNTKAPILSIDNVTKKFGKLQAVSNLSLDLYTGEVCTLLGHNGAGKTTTTFILVGMLEPTSGSITVEGLDGQLHIQEIRKIIGFCPQYDILYNELSVKEHLKLVAEMRQMGKKEAEQCINNVLDLIGLADQQHTWAKNLSGGMKRRLSIGISLVGDSKILILDEPTSGIDPYNRRFIWTIIRKMKEAGKCIIMTTHFLEEADVLSDRIAVMTRGHLQAYGRPDFLKQQTDFEYRIFIEKNDSCNIENIMKFFQEHAETAVLERQSASEIVFGIRRGATQRISRLINALNEHGLANGINGYSLSMTTVEEVFLKLIEEEEENEERNGKKHNPEKTNTDLANTVFRHNFNRIIGFSLAWTRLCNLMLKRWILSYRQLFVLLGFFLGPIIIEILIISTLPTPKGIQATLLQTERIENAQVTVLPSLYNPQSIVVYSNEVDNQMKGYLTNYLTSMGAKLEIISTNNIIDYVSARNSDSYDTYVNKYQMGFSIVKDFSWFTLDAYFSSVNFHTIPTSLSVLTNCLFQYYSNSSSKRIITTNQPFYIISSAVTARALFYDQIYCFDTVPFSLFNFLNTIIVSIFISILALNVIRERITHSKDLQLLTNTTKKLYWLSNFLYDFMLCLLVTALLTVVVKIGAVLSSNPDAEVYVYRGSEQIGYFFVLSIMFSLASLPFMYSYSFIVKSELIGFIMFFIINVLACFSDMVIGFIAVFSQVTTTAHTYQMSSTTRNMMILRWVLAGIFPSINFKQSLFNIRLRSDPSCISAINMIMATTYSSTESWVSLNDPGIGMYLIIFTCQIVFWWIVLTCIENRNKIKKYICCCCCCCNRKEKKSIYAIRKKKNDNSATISSEWDDSKLDKDVREERRMVLHNDNLSSSNVLVVRDLVLLFRKRKQKKSSSHYFAAVDHLNFYVPKQSCFGLLGANGAGKTTTFRMLINAIQPTAGEIIINGRNINETDRDIEVGFCPQFDWLIEDLTVIETLNLFARLKGVTSSEISIICNEMVELFGLEPYRRCKIQNLSGGNKRKVSTAVAFMANPSLIFLDEPTTGLDAGAKRKLWSVIRAARDAGLTIIMTSHSMEECEALCTKIGIMKSGQFVCLGTLQRLKNRFGKGYAVQIKLSPEKKGEFQQELTTSLPGIKIEDEQNDVLFCNVPFSSNLSVVFEVLSAKKEEHIIENYSIAQTTLEQIFVRLAGHDVNDDDTVTETESMSSQPTSNTNSTNQEFVMHCAASETTFETLDLNQIISPDSINTRF